MYRQPSKRKVIIQRTAVYVLMTVSIVSLVTVLVFVILGYQYDSSNGKIEQGGLVQFDSQPTGANITIDGRLFGAQTASKTTMTTGLHTISMSSPGYQTWQKTVNVLPGAVLWLDYPRLIPNKLTPQEITTFPTVTSTAVSPDSHWMVIQQDATNPVITLADVSNDAVHLKYLTLPSTVYTQPTDPKTQSFTFTSWNSGSRYVLVKHAYDSKIEWLVVDTQNVAASQNISTLLGIDASNIVFSNSDSNTLYAQIGQDVRKIDISAATLSRPLITNVSEFALYSDSVITYTTLVDPTTKTRSIGYYVDGAAAPTTVRTYADDGTTPLHFTVARYYSQTFEGIDYGSTVEILQGDLPRNGGTASLVKVGTMTIPGGAQYLTNMTNGRFIVAQNGGTFSVYDLELQKATTTVEKGTAVVSQPLQWLDNYTIWSDRDGTIRLYEFDGANQHSIMSVVPGFSAVLSPNGKYLYGITKSSNGLYHLSRVQLIIS